MPDIAHDTGFHEIADRCWVARFEFLDVNVGLVGGDRGLLVVDTHASEVEARRVVEQVRRLGVGDVVAVVNTHQHFDHTFGNVVFSEAYDGPPIIAHEEAAAELARSAPPLQEFARTDDSDPRHADIAATRVLLPTETFSSARAVDLGNRMELYTTNLDMTVNNYDKIFVAKGEQIVDVWPIMGRSGSAQR